MRKLFYTLSFVACLIISLASCSKEDNKQNIEENKTVTLTLSAEKVASTKTAAIEGTSSVSYQWTAEDVANMKLFTVEGETLTEVSSPVVTIVSDRKLTITTDVTPNTSYTFRAVLCNPNNYTGSGNNYSTRKPKVAPTQSPNGTSNFDPAADILVSDDLVVTVGESDSEYEATNLVFRRMVVMNKMTLKNMVAGEKVSKVVIQSDKYLTGNLTSTSNTASMNGQLKEITINYNDVTVPANGEFPVYFATMPNDAHTLTVNVYTDQYTYTKTFGAGNINFVKGQFTTFGVTLPAGTPVVSFADGDYVIANASGDKVAIKYTSGNNCTAKTVSLVSGDIVYTGSIDFFTFTKVTSGDYTGKYTINDADGNYYYGTSGSNKFQAGPFNSSSALYYWEVSENSNGNHDITNVGSSRVLKYNATNNIFNTYASGQNEIKLYTSANVKQATEIQVTSDNPMAVANTAGSHTIEYTIVNPIATSSISATTTATWITNIDYSVDGEVTFDVAAQEPGAAGRSGVITLSYDGAEDVSVTINQAAGSGSSVHTYTYTITPNDFNGSSYAGTTVSTITAVATDDNTLTLNVDHTPSDCMKQSGKIQFKASTGLLYNTTDLGTITNVEVVGANQTTYAVYIGSSQNPTSDGSGGYFAIKRTGKNAMQCSSIIVTFQK